MYRFKLCIIGCLVAASLASAEEADRASRQDPRRIFNRTGFIENARLDRCWYTQTYQEPNPHFMPADLKHTTHHDLHLLRFSDPKCMASSLGARGDVLGDINKSKINQMVTSWFLGTVVRRDANFEVYATYSPGKSGFQGHGECIQSKKYPSKGIAIEYVFENDAIKSVIYMGSVGGCGDKKIWQAGGVRSTE